MNPTPLPLAEIEGELAVVRDTAQGNRLYGKHCYGQPLPGGGLELSLLEAAYLSEQGRIRVNLGGAPLDFPGLLRHLVSETGIGYHRYAGYRDLKSRGFIVKLTSPFDFSLFPGGTSLRRALSKKFVDVYSERESFLPERMYEKAERAEELRKAYMVEVVDEEGDITYYDVSAASPRGTVPHETPKHVVEGSLLGGRVIVFDLGSLSGLFVREFVGQVRGRCHQLSLVEAAFLLKRGALLVSTEDGNDMDLEAFLELGSRHERDLPGRFSLYEELKERGLLVKTGFKYGAYFRAYREDPECSHADFLVHLLPLPEGPGWPEVSRSVRVAHGVRKKMLFAFPGKGGEMRFLRVERVKPSC